MILWTLCHIYNLITVVRFKNLLYYCNCCVITLSFSLYICLFNCVRVVPRVTMTVCLERAFSRVWLSPKIDGVNNMWLYCIMYLCVTFVNKVILFYSILLNGFWCLSRNIPGKLVNTMASGPLFTKRTDVSPPNLVKSRSRETRCCNDRIALKFDTHLGRGASQIPELLEKVKPESRGFETSRDLGARRPSA